MKLEQLLDNFRHAAIDAYACGNDFGTGTKLGEAEQAIEDYVYRLQKIHIAVLHEQQGTTIVGQVYSEGNTLIVYNGWHPAVESCGVLNFNFDR